MINAKIADAINGADITRSVGSVESIVTIVNPHPHRWSIGLL